MHSLHALLPACASICVLMSTTAAMTAGPSRARASEGNVQTPGEDDYDQVVERLVEQRRHTIKRVNGSLDSGWESTVSLPQKYKAVQEIGRATRFYLGGDVAAFEAAHNCSGGRFITGAAEVQFLTEVGQLSQLRGALWDNDEYTLENYFVVRLLCGDLSRVATPEAADLCYPTCGDAHEQKGRVDWRQKLRDEVGRSEHLGGFDIENLGLIFEVPEAKREKWHYCRNIGLFYEVEERSEDDRQGMWKRCKIMVPYMHGVAQVSGESRMPYDKKFRRPSLISYVGGTTTGFARGRLLKELKEYSRKYASENTLNNATSPRNFSSIADSTALTSDPEGLFAMPFELPHNVGKFWHSKEMHKLVWEQYAASEFSWHPFGDTPTRRGFYDAWMFGSIPVVPYTSAKYYRQLFKRALFPHLKDCVVLIPQTAMSDGPSLISWITNTTAEARHRRRSMLRELAPMMQWGWKAEGDALVTALGLLQMDDPRSQLQGDFLNRSNASSDSDCSDGDCEESVDEEAAVNESQATQISAVRVHLAPRGDLQHGHHAQEDVVHIKNFISSGIEQQQQPIRDPGAAVEQHGVPSKPERSLSASGWRPCWIAVLVAVSSTTLPRIGG